MFPDIPLEAVHSRDGALILVESAIDLACGIVYVGHKHALRPPAFKPVVMAAVQLEHLTEIMLTLPPLPVRPDLAPLLPLPCLDQPRPDSLLAYLYPLQLKQLLRGKRRPKTLILLLVQLLNPRYELPMEPPVGFLAPRSVLYPLITLRAYSLHYPPYLPLT